MLRPPAVMCLQMPSTRSQSQAQPTLAFPRRKTCRVSSRSKTPREPELAVQSPSKPDGQFSTQTPTWISPLAPRCPAAPPPSPSLQPRVPLSPRKRTGESLPEGTVLCSHAWFGIHGGSPKGPTTAATSVPAWRGPLRSKAGRLRRPPASSAWTRILRIQPAGSWCLCLRGNPALLLSRCHGARSCPAGAPTSDQQSVNRVPTPRGRLTCPFRVF